MLGEAPQVRDIRTPLGLVRRRGASSPSTPTLRHRFQPDPQFGRILSTYGDVFVAGHLGRPGQSQSEISEILSGRRVMAYDLLLRIADGLGVGRGLMGMAYDPAAGAVGEVTTPRWSP